jgi:hypothetical protein
LWHTEKKNHRWYVDRSAPDSGQSSQQTRYQANSESNTHLGELREVGGARQRLRAGNHSNPSDKKDKAERDGQASHAHPVHRGGAQNRSHYPTKSDSQTDIPSN